MSFMDDFEYGISNFFSLGGKSRREQTKALNEQTKLQREQFDYQKWYDQNNVTLALKQNMDAGINPMVAQGAGTSSVTASASPQMPNAVVPDTSLLSNLMSKLFDKKMNDDDLDIQQKKVNNDKEVADKLIALKDKQLDLENRRTGAYESDVDARVKNLLREYETSLKDGYGRGSTWYKKLFGEFKSLMNNGKPKTIDEASSVLDTGDVSLVADEFDMPEEMARALIDVWNDATGKTPQTPSSYDTSDDWDAYLKHKIQAEKNGHPNYTWSDWIQAGKPK